MASNLEANMRKTAEGFLFDFNGTWKEGATLKFRAPECQHLMLPGSMKTTRNNDEFAAFFKRVAGLITDADVSSSVNVMRQVEES